MPQHPIVNKILNNDSFQRSIGELGRRITAGGIADAILAAIDVLAREALPGRMGQPHLETPEPDAPEKSISVEEFTDEMFRKFSDNLCVPCVSADQSAPMTAVDEYANVTRLRQEIKAEMQCRDGWKTRALEAERASAALRDRAIAAEKEVGRLGELHRDLRRRLVRELTCGGVQLPCCGDPLAPGAVRRGVEEVVAAGAKRIAEAEAEALEMQARAIAAEKQLGDLRVRMIGELTDAGAFLCVNGDPLAPGEVRGAVKAAVRRAVADAVRVSPPIEAVVKIFQDGRPS